jgi:hypothetical protein
VAATDQKLRSGLKKMQVFNLFKSRVLLAAVVAVLSASLVQADQNDRKDRDNRGNGQSAKPSNGPSVRSLNSGNSGNSGSAARSFSNSNNSNSNNNAARSFQSQGSGGGSSNDSSNRSQQTVVRQTDSHAGADAAKFSNKGSNINGNAQSSTGSNSRATVLGQQIQGNNQQNNNQQHNNQQGARGNSSNGSSGNSSQNVVKFRGNDNARIAENDDHKNKGDNKGGGNNGQNNQGQNNQNNQNNGRNRDGDNNRDNGKQQGTNPSFKTGTPPNGGKGLGTLPGSNNGLPGSSNGPKFDVKNGDIKNGDHRDKDFGRGNFDKNHDGKPDNQVTVKDLFDHNKVGDNHQNGARNSHDRDFHGKDSAKVEFNKWNDVWKGKNGGGKDNRDWSGKWRSGDRFVAADAIRHDFFSHHDMHHDLHNMPFQASWWDSHHDHDHGWHFWGDYALHHHHHPYYWWGWASAPALTTWCNFGWNQPYYWDYGPGEYIYCNSGNVYVNGRLYEAAPVYYAQTVRLIDQAPLLDADAAAQADWMPLGVFAVTPDGANQPSVMVQLAVTKDGIIGGTATDQQAGASFNIQGTVDKNTQRAIWSYVDANNSRIVMESSINNLTQNESTGLIHYNANDQRVVEFVRMPEPNEQAELPMPGPGDAPVGAGPSLPPPAGQ